MEETEVKVKGVWRYLYRAVDKDGHTVDFLLTAHRARAAAEAFLHKAIRAPGLPEKIPSDQSGSNTAAIKHSKKIHKTAIVIRQWKSLNNLGEQDQRGVKRLVRPRLGVNSFWAACCRVGGIEVMHAIRKGQLATRGNASQAPAEQFYALAAEVTDSDSSARPHLKFATDPSDAAIGFINHVFSRNDKGVGISEMPMQQDLLVRVEFDNEIDTVLCFIDLLEDVDDASEQGEEQE